ncbi:HutD family protein [Bordetella bronchialis]|uniref:HutD/Ves family protein n=1 Tax=Bordetella bronchialis TaxID=463025 RepID=UPI003D054320
METVPFRLADVAARPWKNGGGTTREIACWPPGAGLDDFLWRISVARIDAGGPFSRFAGVDRVITLLSGDGVLLRGGFPGGEHALTRPLAPFAFPGDVDVDCALQGGPSEDFNVMSRRGRARARVTVLPAAGELPPASCGLLMAVGGTWRVRGDKGHEHILAPDMGLWWAATARGWRIRRDAGQGDGGLIAVTIDTGTYASTGDAQGHEPL